MVRREDFSISLFIMESQMVAFATIFWSTILVCYLSLAFEFGQQIPEELFQQLSEKQCSFEKGDCNTTMR